MSTDRLQTDWTGSHISVHHFVTKQVNHFLFFTFHWHTLCLLVPKLHVSRHKVCLLKQLFFVFGESWNISMPLGMSLVCWPPREVSWDSLAISVQGWQEGWPWNSLSAVFVQWSHRSPHEFQSFSASVFFFFFLIQLLRQIPFPHLMSLPSSYMRDSAAELRT